MKIIVWTTCENVTPTNEKNHNLTSTKKKTETKLVEEPQPRVNKKAETKPWSRVNKKVETKLTEESQPHDNKKRTRNERKNHDLVSVKKKQTYKSI